MDILNRGAVPQHIAGIILNILTFLHGTILRMCLPLEISKGIFNSTNLTESIELEFETRFIVHHEAYLYAVAILYIAAIISSVFFGCLVNFTGRKQILVIVGIFLLLSYVFDLSVSDGFIFHTLVGGPGLAAVSIFVPIYIGEIAEDNIRGLLGSYFNLFLCLGMLFTTVIEYLYFLTNMVWFHILLLPLLCILFLAGCIWLPESPVYSLLKIRTEEAKNALFKLRGNKTRELIQEEFQNLEASVQKIIYSQSNTFLNTMLNPATIKALIIGFVLVIVRQLCSINRVMFFKDESGDIISSHALIVVVALLQVVGAIFATGLIEKLGRKVLLLASSTGMLVAIFFQLLYILCESDAEPKWFWLTLIAHAIYIVSFHMGYGSVPWVLFSEIFKEKVRGPVISLYVLIIYLLDFYVKFPLDDFYLAILAVNCILGAVFVYFYVPETKGKSIDFIFTKLGDEEIQRSSRLI